MDQHQVTPIGSKLDFLLGVESSQKLIANYVVVETLKSQSLALHITCTRIVDIFDLSNYISQLVTASTDLQIPNMAEKNVSDPPTVIPKAKAPASEALLDEKVRIKLQGRDWSDRSSREKWHATLLPPSTAIPLLSSTC